MSHLDEQIDGIAKSIVFLQKIYDDWGELPTKDMFEKDEQRYWYTLVELIPEMEENPDFPDVWFGYTGDMLDIILESKQSIGSEVVPTKLRYVVTTGGPHIEIVADLLPERLTVEGYWGTDKATRVVNAYNMYNHMAHYAEMMCDTLNNY